jgi:hypothetical protein
LNVSTRNSPFFAGVAFLKNPVQFNKAKNKINVLWKIKIAFGERKEQENVCHIICDE